MYQIYTTTVMLLISFVFRELLMSIINILYIYIYIIYIIYKRSVLRRRGRDANRNIILLLWRRANARNLRLYYLYRHYTNLFIFCILRIILAFYTWPSWLSWQSVALDSRGREFDSHRRPWSCIFRNWSRLSLRKFTHSQNILIVYLFIFLLCLRRTLRL